MAGRASLVRAEPGFSLPFFDRLAPPPPPGLLAGRIEMHTAPGDIVLDINGRGGWIARAAVDRQRRAVSLESNPLTRLLAELVLRPPDLRHLDAAFQAMGGVDVTLSPLFALTADVRRVWARTALSRVFRDFDDKIDLSGVTVALGFTVRL